MPKIIHQSWKDDNIPSVYKPEWIQSWKDMFPDWQYRFWTDRDNDNLVKLHPAFYVVYSHYDYAIKRADAARYFYMYYYGGIYADLDFICLNNFEHLLTSPVIIGDLGEHNTLHPSHRVLADSRYPNALMVSEPFHPFWIYVIERLIAQGTKVGTSANDTTGPAFLTRCIRGYTNNLTQLNGIKICEPVWFYPIDWRKEAAKPFNLNRRLDTPTVSELRVQFMNSFAVTYWTHFYKG